MSGIAHRLWRMLASPLGSRFLLGIEILLLYCFYGWHPIFVQTYANVDDGLFVQQATGFLSYLSGRSDSWLGGFDCFLLCKVPLYGLWLAFLNILGIPLRVGDFLVLLAGAFLFRQAVKPARVLRVWEFGVVLFLLLANPFLDIDNFLRRFTFHAALTNLCLIAILGLVLRARQPSPNRWLWALSSGLLIGLCNLSREEATWLSAVALVAFLLLGTSTFLEWRRREVAGQQALFAQAGVAAALLVGAFLPLFTVSTINQRHYGVFMTAFRRSSAMTGLVERLSSLEPAGHQPYVPIARATRLRAYELSPSFAKLKPWLEGELGMWRAGEPSHAAFNHRRPEDRELFVSNFEFCLLWAARGAGAKRASEIAALFRAIDRELAHAVREGKIRAGSHGFGILAAPVQGDYWRMVPAFWRSLSPLLFVGMAGYAWPAEDWPKATRAQLDVAGNLTGSWPVPEPLPNLKYLVRAPVVRRIKQVQTVIYPSLFLAMPALVIWRRREAFTTNPSMRTLLLWSFSVPMAGLLAFCLSMAVVEVLGFKFLYTIGYDILGYSPLTVLCALAFVGLVVFCRWTPATRPPEATPG